MIKIVDLIVSFLSTYPLVFTSINNTFNLTARSYLNENTHCCWMNHVFVSEADSLRNLIQIKNIDIKKMHLTMTHVSRLPFCPCEAHCNIFDVAVIYWIILTNSGWNIWYRMSYILNTNRPALNLMGPGDTCVLQWTGVTLVQVISCRLCLAKSLTEPKLIYSTFEPWEQKFKV